MDRRRAAAALLALAACFATVTAAPTSNHTALDLYDDPTEGCYYNFQHYGEGDRIMTNEPCLNCTCHNRMLMCYLRVCPFTKPIGQDCTVEKRADQCCPIVTCPDVPVDLLTSTSTTSPAEYGGTGVGKVDNYGCSINGKYFPEGAKVPPTPNKPCEHCYCIRNMTTCVMQECTLHVDGCTPIYHKDVCCPVRYFCDHPEDDLLQLDDMTTTTRPTPGFLLTTTTTEPPTTEIQTKRECTEDGQIYPDGALIKTEKPCVHCYCMKGDIVCVVQECGTPMENEGKNCSSMPPREGQCCPDTYICEGDDITTETPFEEITTILPPEITTRRESVEGSGYRKEPGETYKDPSVSFETEGSGEEEILPTTSSDFTSPIKQTTDKMIENKFGVSNQDISIVITTESPAYEVEEQATTEPDKGLNTGSNDISEDEHSKPSVLEHTTSQADIVATISSTRLVQETSVITSSPKPVTEMAETTSDGEIMEKSTIVPSLQIEDEILPASPRDEDEVTESITETTVDTKLTTVFGQSKTTLSKGISEETTETILTEQTTVKPDSMIDVKLTETTATEVYNETPFIDFTELSSEPPLKEKSTTTHNIIVTESRVTDEEREVSSPVLQEETTTQMSEITEPVIFDEEHTTHKKIIAEESSEPSLIDKTTSVDAITESKVHKTTAPSIFEDAITIATTSKFVEEEEKLTEQTTAKEDQFTTIETLTKKDTDATPKPSYETTLVPAVESEGEPFTDQTSEHHINEEKVSTFVTTTEVVPQEEKQDTTDVTVITTLQPGDRILAETTTLNPEDNEITEDILPPGRIPGEGDCLFNGVTYRNESSVPNRNKCETSCKCISSIIKCNPIICSSPPEYMENCQLVYDTSESCCPTYICEETKETIPPQSHSQMSGTEIPTSTPSLQCSGDECELSLDKKITPVSVKYPSRDDCGSEGCITQVPEQTNISGEEPEKCVGDKCTSECLGGNCQLPSSQDTQQNIPSQTTPETCQSSDECREDKTEIPVCQGEVCISKTPTSSEISTPCEGDSCQVVPQDCTSDKCSASAVKPLESEICSDEKDCKQSEEKDCQDDNCKRNEDRIETSIQPLPPKCTDQDCPQAESSPLDEEPVIIIPTTEQILLPDLQSTSVGDITPEVANVITDSSIERITSTPQITADHRVPESLSTEKPEKSRTTQAPQITGVEGENTVPYEEITETEMHYTKQPMPAATEMYTDKDMITNPTETEREYTISPAVTENQEVTSSPVEFETQHEDTSSKSPDSSFYETETEKLQTQLLPKQPDQQEQFTKAPESEQPTETTDYKTNNEQTETPDKPNISTLSTQQDIAELKTTPEYTEQSTVLPESTEKLGKPESIPTISKDMELPEKSEEQEGTTILPESEKKTTKLTLSDSTKQSVTQHQEFTYTSTEEPIAQEEIKTDLPGGLVTDSLKPIKDETDTETPVSPDTILYDTESPLETDKGEKVAPEIPETITKETESPVFDEQTERIFTTNKPEETITPVQKIQEKEQYTKMPTTETYLSLETNPSEEPDKTIELEILTETTRKPEETITPEQGILEKEQHPETFTTESSLSLQTNPLEELDKTVEPKTSTETTIKPKDIISPEQEILEKEQRPELPTAESSFPLETKPSEEPIKTIEPEMLTEATVSHIFEPTGPTILRESTSEKETTTDKSMQTGTELSIPVSITEEPDVGTKETQESQLCESESECKKSQVPEAEMPPCQGDSCIEDKKGCDSIDCSQNVQPPKTTPTEICDKETVCEKPSQEESSECTDENCRKSEVSDSGQKETPIFDIEITTIPPSRLEEELYTKISFEPHITGTEIPITEPPSFGIDKTTKESFVEEPEKDVTGPPESIITLAPIVTESHKYYTSEKIDVTRLEEPVTLVYEITTTEPKKSETELPSYQEIIPETDITAVPEDELPIEQQGKVTETPVPTELTGVQESSTMETELPKSTERDNDVTEQPKTSAPVENELTEKPENGVLQTLIPEQPEPELSQPEIITAGYSGVTSITEQDNKMKDEESQTQGTETFITTPGLSNREHETTLSQQSEDEVPEITDIEIASSVVTELPQITEKEYSETTPYLVELEEHPHEIKESITTLLPSEESITQEPTDVHDTEIEPVFEMSTQTPSQTETSLKFTEKPSKTISTDAPTTVLDEILEKSTEPSIFEEASTEPFKPSPLDMLVPDSNFTTEPKDQENEISTVSSMLSETKETTQVSPETEKPQTPIEENVPETTQDNLSSTASVSEEEFSQSTTKTTSLKTDEDIATKSPAAVDKYTKPETSTDMYPSAHTAETQKPDTVPTDESPQPEEESHFPPPGSYEPEQETDYGEEDQFGPGTCRYGGKVYVSAQQIPRDDPCDFCFCFRSDIICLQQSCPPPIHGCHEEPIQGFCCPRYECPVSMATTLNVTTTTTTTTTTLPPHFLPHAYKGAAQRKGCQIKGHIYKVGEVVRASSGPCLHCTCGGDGQMKCDPKVCTPEPMLRQMIAAAVSAKRRR